MSLSKSRLFALQISLLFGLAYAPTAQSWNLFGPNNYEDCVLDGIKNAKSDRATNLVIHACRSKFPDKTPATKYDLPGNFLYSSLGISLPILNQLTRNINLNKIRVVQTGTKYSGYKSFDYGHHLSLEITNRNDFPINGVEIGLPLKKESTCSWDDKHYLEIYTCSGIAGSRGSGVFRCEIPRVESRQVRVCLTGFIFYGTRADASAFMQKYNIPYP